MTTIITKNGSGAPTAGQLAQGELAVDLTNKELYTKDSGGNVIKVGAQGGSTGTFTDLTATVSFTSPGIDDNATSTQITVTNTDVDFSGNIDVTGTATLPDANVTTLDVTGVSTLVDADVTTLDVTGTATLADANVTVLDVTGVSTLATVTADVAVAGTQTANATGSTTLDFSANQNFVLTLTGNVTLANPTTETVGQSGFIVMIQDATGGRTVSLGTEYETAGAGGLTLSTAASTTDIVPYIVAASGRILLGAPQLAFA